MPSSADLSAPVKTRCLYFDKVAPGRPYHAALSATAESRARGYRINEHSHDFYEMLFVLAGDAIHGLNGIPTLLHAGELILLRPGDRHFIRFNTGRFLHYINIAVEAAMWRGFHDLAGIGTNLDAPIVRDTIAAPEGSLSTKECAAAFQHALERFQDTRVTNAALRTEACRLLAIVAPLLFASARQNSRSDADLPDGVPIWLIRSCKKLQRDPDALRSGLPVFIAEAGVTRTHLARVLKAATNKTPTEYINQLRLEYAARLLTTTTLSVLDISGECGFEQPTYFYRLFSAHFQTSPHAYRTAAARRVAPK